MRARTRASLADQSFCPLCWQPNLECTVPVNVEYQNVGEEEEEKDEVEEEDINEEELVSS